MAQDRPIGNMKFGIGFDGFDESLTFLIITVLKNGEITTILKKM